MKNKNSKKQINILVAVKISHTSGRDLLSGIFKFLEANVSWQIHLVQTTEEFSAKLREQFNQNDFDGIIATFPISDEAIDLLAASDLPTVLVNIEDKRLLNRNGKTSFIKNDNAAIGKKAANLFLTNGQYASFVCFSNSDSRWSYERSKGFEDALKENKKDCLKITIDTISGEAREKSKTLQDILVKTPKPSAIYATSDECAIKILKEANTKKIKIPYDIGLLGTDNDEFLVSHSNPPISSIVPGHTKMGLRAAQELKKLVDGDLAPEKPIYISPVNIIERMSTKPIMPGNILVKHIKAYIKANYNKRLRVSDIASHLGISKRLAELRFKQTEGISIHKAIEELRVREAKKLLQKSELSITEIAKRTGFLSQNRLAHFFKQHFSMSPTQWREHHIAKDSKH